MSNELPATGFIRLASILSPNGPIPVSKSTWWAGIKDGRFPSRSNLVRASPHGVSKTFGR